MERAYRHVNPVIRAIPLVATLKEISRPEGEGGPVPDVAIHFQLVPSEASAYLPKRPANEQVERPPLRDSTIGPPPHESEYGPGKRVYFEEARPLDLEDPQLSNCPPDRGGKRSGIFSTASWGGFHTAHERRELSHPPYPLAYPTALQNKHHTVEAKTNSQGEAGVIFEPSRCGGDRYSIRAFAELEDGSTVEVETGTMVIWRNIRISRYVRMEMGPPHPMLVEQAAAYNISEKKIWQRVGSAEVSEEGIWPFDSIRIEPITEDPLPMVDLRAKRDEGLPFPGIVDEFARAFCEVELDWVVPNPEEIKPEPLLDSEWRAARAAAIEAGRFGMWEKDLEFDLDLLLCTDVASINVRNAVSLLPMRSPEAYDATLPPGSPKTLDGLVLFQHKREGMKWIRKECLYPGFLGCLSKEGMLPGLTILQAPSPFPWNMLGVDPWDLLGRASPYRAVGCFQGKSMYPTRVGQKRTPLQDIAYWDITSCVLHEVGHCLNRSHAPRITSPGDEGYEVQEGVRPEEHDPLADTVCGMSYQTSEGGFCGKCLLALRGWNIRRLEGI
jgi:hypothetical protein